MQWVSTTGKRQKKRNKESPEKQYAIATAKVISRIQNRMQRVECNVDGGNQTYWFDSNKKHDGTAYNRETLEVTWIQPYCMSCYSGWHNRYFPGHDVGLVNGQYVSKDGPRNYHPELEAVMARFPTLFRKETSGFTRLPEEK